MILNYTTLFSVPYKRPPLPMSIQALMTGISTAMSLSSTAIVRPFGPIVLQRPDSPMPVSPLPSGKNKRKMFAISDYDPNVHVNAPIRPNHIARPYNGLNSMV